MILLLPKDFDIINTYKIQDVNYVLESVKTELCEDSLIYVNGTLAKMSQNRWSRRDNNQKTKDV